MSHEIIYAASGSMGRGGFPAMLQGNRLLRKIVSVLDVKRARIISKIINDVIFLPG